MGITGLSSLSLDAGDGPPLGAVAVEEALSFAKLGVIGENLPPDVFLHSSTPGVNGYFQEIKSANLRVDSFLMPYDFTQLAPGETPLFQVGFEFAVETRLNITNQDDLGNFEALFDADFSNTATLKNVTVLDDSFEPISGATVTDAATGQSLVPSAVPEPSTIALLSLAGGAIFIRRRRVS